MPSIETVVASVVRQDRTTWSPAEMVVGVAEICAVGAGAAAGGAVSWGKGGACFFLQPAIVKRVTTSATGTKMRPNRFKTYLLLRAQSKEFRLTDHSNRGFRAACRFGMDVRMVRQQSGYVRRIT